MTIEDLLAVIHRDGGHHTINAGMDRSIADAAQEIHRLRADAEKWIAIDAELRAALEMCLDFCQGQAGSYPHDCVIAARKALGR